jgi:hypothetical protein
VHDDRLDVPVAAGVEPDRQQRGLLRDGVAHGVAE